MSTTARSELPSTRGSGSPKPTQERTYSISQERRVRHKGAPPTLALFRGAVGTGSGPDGSASRGFPCMAVREPRQPRQARESMPPRLDSALAMPLAAGELGALWLTGRHWLVPLRRAAAILAQTRRREPVRCWSVPPRIVRRNPRVAVPRVPFGCTAEFLDRTAYSSSSWAVPSGRRPLPRVNIPQGE